MPTTTEVADNAKKLKQKIADQAGVAPKDLNDKNLGEAHDMLSGAQQVTAQGSNPTQVDPQQLKALGGGEGNVSSEADLTKQKKIAMAITAIAPTLLGYAFGGYQGGGIGAKVSEDALNKMSAQEEKERVEKGEYASKSALKKEELTAKAEENEKDRQNRLAIAKSSEGDKTLGNELKAQRLSDMQEKAAFGKSTEGKIAKLSKEKQDSLYKAKEALQGVQGMAQALIGNGQNTFSMVGSNDFTRNSSMFEEALGRMQSGGAITSDEVKNFMKMRPTAADSSEQQKKKLIQLESMMQDRLKIMGFQPEDLGVPSGFVVNNYDSKNHQVVSSPMVPKAEAGVNMFGRVKPLEEMSEEELQAHVKKLKGQ